MTEKEVLEQFESGLDCSHVVLMHWAKKLGCDTQTASRIATGFGAGMMHGETCGAVVGAYMAIGLKYGMDGAGQSGLEQKAAAIAKGAEFRQKLLEKYPSSMCRELLGADFSTAEGRQAIMEKNLLTTFCPKLVADVLVILDEIM